MIARELLAASDFTMVRAELVRALDGDAAAALVLTRIHWRQSRESDGEWWRGTAAQLADETGLSRDQVKRSIGKLRDAGHLETVMERAEGAWDRTASYRVVMSGCAQSAEAPNAEVISLQHGADSPNVHGADSPNVPSTKTLKKTKNVSREDRAEAIEAWLRSDADKAWQRDREIPSRFTLNETYLWKGWLNGPTPAAKRTVDYSRSWRNWMLRSWSRLYESQRRDWWKVEREHGEIA